MFWVLKSPCGGSFEYPKQMFWLRNQKKKFIHNFTHDYLDICSALEWNSHTQNVDLVGYIVQYIFGNHISAWVKVFRIIPEFRILRLTPQKVRLKFLNKADHYCFSDLFQYVFSQLTT